MGFKVGSAEAAKVLLAPDGEHVLAQWRDGEHIRRVLDGYELPKARWLKGRQPEVLEAEALNRVGWLERSEQGVSVVMTNFECTQRLGPFDDVKWGRHCFTSDGLRLAFAFERAKSWWVWLDGEELGPFSAVESVGFVDGALLLEARRGRRSVVRLGDFESDEFEGVFWPKRAPDGTFAFGFKRGSAFFIRQGDSTLGPFRSKPRFAVGSGGRSAVYLEVDGDARLELDGELVLQLQGHVVRVDGGFSPDGSRFGVAYQDRGFAGFYLDGVRRDQLGYADGPWWSPDSAHVAWCADDDRGLLVVDGVETALGARVDFEEGSSFRFAPDGRFCLVLSDEASGEQLLRVGGSQFGPFFLESSARRSAYEKIAFSADGAQLAFRYRDATGKSFVHRGDERFGPLDSRSSYTLTADGTLCIAAFDPQALEVRVERH